MFLLFHMIELLFFLLDEAFLNSTESTQHRIDLICYNPYDHSHSAKEKSPQRFKEMGLSEVTLPASVFTIANNLSNQDSLTNFTKVLKSNIINPPFL